MKYDDASWHHGDTFPTDLPLDAASTQAGMFLVWAILRGLGASRPRGSADRLALLTARQISPGQFLVQQCQATLTDQDLNKDGNAFAGAYYDADGTLYLADYDAVLTGELPSTYHVADTWANFDLLVPALDARLAQWRAGTLGGPLPPGCLPKRPWWKWR